MSYLGSWKLNDNITFSVNTHRVDTGVATDADAVPTYRVYEDETAAPLTTGSMILFDSANTAGYYTERFQITSAAGYQKGSVYHIYVTATVNSIEGTKSFTFQVEAEVDANVVSDKTGYSITAGGIAPGAFSSAAIDANAIATDAIGAAELATDAVNEIRDAILADSTPFNGADIATIASDVVLIYSDTTAIHSDTTIIHSDTIVISSDTAVIESDTTAIHSDTTIIASDVVLVYSDTTAIHSDTTIIHSDTIVISSDTAVIESDTTAIHSDTTIIASDVVLIYSDTTIAVSDTTVIEAFLTSDAMTENSQQAPPATPTFEEAVMYLYMALRNKIDVTSTLLEFHNDAGTVIWKKTLSDDGTTYSEAEGATGP